MADHKKRFHHYVECGLDNIYIQELYARDDDGDKYLYIPAVAKLHKLIARILLSEKRLLSGKEVRFLRGELGMSVVDVAQRIGITASTLKKWEVHDSVANNIDAKFRQFFRRIKPDYTKLGDSAQTNAESHVYSKHASNRIRIKCEQETYAPIHTAA